MFTKFIKNKKMLKNEDMLQHSVVAVTGSINDILNNATQSNVASIKIEMPFHELANGAVINHILKQMNISEIVTPFIATPPINKEYRSQNIIFRSEIDRISVWQTGSFDKRHPVSIFKSLLEFDSSGILLNKVSAIGINYQHKLNINDEEAGKLLHCLTDAKIHQIDNKSLITGNLYLTYSYNEYCTLNIQINKNHNGIWFISFNANNIINQSNDFNKIMSTDFEKEYHTIANKLLYVKND